MGQQLFTMFNKLFTMTPSIVDKFGLTSTQALPGMKTRERTAEIRQFIIDHLPHDRVGVASITAKEFGITRAAVARHLKALITKNVIKAHGQTRGRNYSLVPIVHDLFSIHVEPGVAEDVVWRERVAPLLAGQSIKENVLSICNYGFTEMLNNAIEHSESDTVSVTVTVDAAAIHLQVRDFGIGVFKKLMRDFNLSDPRHALLELSKGKLTSDASRHSGQGIFFTSRMFDEYTLIANGFSFFRYNKEDDWLFESREPMQGTTVHMDISLRASQTAADVMNEYTAELHDYGFTKTHVPLQLALYEGEQLVSRSQAKRLLMRVDQFKEVWLDFKGIGAIGQAFADEIFRVYANAHPNVAIKPFNTNPEIDAMINRAKGEDVTTPLFSVPGV